MLSASRGVPSDPLVRARAEVAFERVPCSCTSTHMHTQTYTRTQQITQSNAQGHQIERNTNDGHDGTSTNRFRQAGKELQHGEHQQGCFVVARRESAE